MKAEQRQENATNRVEKRLYRVGFRLTKSEWLWLNEQCRKAGVTLSEYLRRKLYGDS
jgi:hypothetical protein